MVDTNRNTSSVIYYCNGIIGIDRYLNFCTKSCQRFVYRIIHDLIYKMMQAPAGCTSNVHTRSFTNGFQTFQNLYLVRTVFCILSAMCFLLSFYIYLQTDDSVILKIGIIILIYYSTKWLFFQPGIPCFKGIYFI